ncbi:hypothetical protein [Sphingomonas sp. LT1P40]|uniref:hypothetical protein n=1 Tax=Alteristakelama amylovorans TaxID=3096166 RepID=UPI002FCA2CED
MREARNEIGDILIRIGKALLIYLVIGAALLGLIFWLTSDFESASLMLRAQFADAEDAQTSVMVILDQARLHLVYWMLTSLAASLICASLFLSFAQSRRPRNAIEGGSYKARWIALLIVALSLSVLCWWQFVSVADVAGALVSKSYVLVLVCVGLGNLLAYYLATGLAVTMTMKPSVPMGTLLPNSWN